MPYSIGAILVSGIWFFVRIVLEMPSGTPIFTGDVFFFGDLFALLLGIVGLFFVIRNLFF